MSGSGGAGGMGRRKSVTVLSARATPEQYHELGGHILAGKVSAELMEVVNRHCRDAGGQVSFAEISKSLYAKAFEIFLASYGIASADDNVTAANFPSLSFERGDYDFELRGLSHDSMTDFEVGAEIACWTLKDESILGAATADDGFFFTSDLGAGRQKEEKNEWILCPGTTSVDGGFLCMKLVEGFVYKMSVCPRTTLFGHNDRVLLRKARS